ncbi:MAG: sugar phosphate isomerase/epimerase family protein [Opitutaceae bacterium]
MSLEEGLALAERHGFGGFDPAIEPLHAAVAQQGAQRVRETFLGRGLRMGAWCLPFAPCTMEEDEWQAWLKKLPPLLGSAAAVGARRAFRWIQPGDNDRGYAVNFEHHLVRFRPVARMLADYGIRLGLEFIGPESARRDFRYPFIHTLAGVLELVRAIGPNCGLLLDSWHWHAAAGTVAEIAALPGEQIVNVHVNDAPLGIARGELQDDRRQLPGTTGVLDLDGFIHALADVGYYGPITAEPFDAELNARPKEEAVSLTAKATRGSVARALRRTDRPLGETAALGRA